MSKKSGKQTKQEKTKEAELQPEESGPYDGLVGEFPTDYVTVCERKGVSPLDVEVNALRPGPYINVVSREGSEPGAVDELSIADTKVAPEHIEPIQLSLDVVPSSLEVFKVLRVPLCETLLQGLRPIAVQKNLRKLILDGCHLPISLSPLFATPLLFLSMKCCSLNDEHCVSIGKGLLRNQHLTGLNLACNRIRDDGAKEIMKGLRVNRSLLILSLTNNHITDCGAASVSEVTIGVLTTSQQMLTEFELTHEEIVTRRQLLLGGGRGEGGGVDQDLSTSMMSPRLSMSLQSADKSGRNSKMDKGKATGKKDLGKKDDNRKKDDQKGKRSSLDKKGVKGKESKGGKKTAGGDQPPETPPPVELPKVVNPLLEHVLEGSSPLRMTGNHALVSLSLAYNHLTDKGANLLISAMSKQDTTSDKGQGLLRLSVKNSLVSWGVLDELEKILVARNPLQEKVEDKIIVEEQVTDNPAE